MSMTLLEAVSKTEDIEIRLANLLKRIVTFQISCFQALPSDSNKKEKSEPPLGAIPLLEHSLTKATVTLTELEDIMFDITEKLLPTNPDQTGQGYKSCVSKDKYS